MIGMIQFIHLHSEKILFLSVSFFLFCFLFVLSETEKKERKAIETEEKHRSDPDSYEPYRPEKTHLSPIEKILCCVITVSILLLSLSTKGVQSLFHMTDFRLNYDPEICYAAKLERENQSYYVPASLLLDNGKYYFSKVTFPNGYAFGPDICDDLVEPNKTIPIECSNNLGESITYSFTLTNIPVDPPYVEKSDYYLSESNCETEIFGSMAFLILALLFMLLFKNEKIYSFMQKHGKFYFIPIILFIIPGVIALLLSGIDNQFDNPRTDNSILSENTPETSFFYDTFIMNTKTNCYHIFEDCGVREDANEENVIYLNYHTLNKYIKRNGGHICRVCIRME